MKRPNIVLISIDTLRADHLSCYGYYRQTTPNIDKLASKGTIYRQNYSTGVWTPPGHASMLTGLYVSAHGVHGEKRLSEHIPTIAVKLKDHGYQTAGFVNNSQVGALVGLEKGHDTFVEVWKGINPKSIIERIARGGIRRIRDKLGYEDMGAKRTNKLFIDWLSDCREKRNPFYVFLHYVEPHNPLNPLRPFRKKFFDKPLKNINMQKIQKIAHNPLICFIEDLKPNEGEIEYLKALYAGEIAYIDSKIGEVIAALKRSNIYNNTMIIITSDHGEHFGEYGLWSHVASLHKEVLKVPLIIKYPQGIDHVEEVNEYTQLVDIFPTIMEAAGINKQFIQGVSSISLIHDGNRDNKYHEYIIAEWEGRVPYFILEKTKNYDNRDDYLEKFKMQMAMIQDKQYKYIWKSDDTEEMYDISKSREMLPNLEIKEEIRSHLRSELLKRTRIMNSVSESTVNIDNEVAKNLKALGYM